MQEISIEQIIKTEDKMFWVNDIVKITVDTNPDMNKTIIGRIYLIDGDIITMDVSKTFNAKHIKIKLDDIVSIDKDIETEC